MVGQILYGFKINGKKIMLELAKPKHSIGNQKTNGHTDKESKKSLYLMSRFQFLKESKENGKEGTKYI